ncbi:hypothetical protein [Mycobacterium sp. URHB0044]|uniref:hypothetical protein n=1 Tax=Mycobacterium sp. URHB0044 TaxID=1380386 RepID=UPI00068798BE|nr:hypothetical protein [Mycobacterium sp. URHB0044]
MSEPYQQGVRTSPTRSSAEAVRTFHIAEGVLVGLTRCSVAQALATLVEVSRVHALSPFTVAEALVAKATGDGVEVNRDAAAVLEREWNRLTSHV